MNWKHAVVASLLSVCAATSASADYCINKDLKNLGPKAYDIAVEITPGQPLTWQYDGNSGAVFNTFSNTLVGMNSVLHWQNVNGVDDPLLHGFVIHVGWCTLYPNAIADMYWTDKAGKRIAGSVVKEVAAHWENSSTPGVRWHNLFGGTVTISDVAVALSSARLDLAALNWDNGELAERLQPLEGGRRFELASDEAVVLSVPHAAPGDWLVVRYAVDGGSAWSTDFVQVQIPAKPKP